MTSEFGPDIRKTILEPIPVMRIAEYLGTTLTRSITPINVNLIRVAFVKPFDKLGAMTLSFNHGAGRAASKLFHLMLNDCQQLIDAIIYGLQQTSHSLSQLIKTNPGGELTALDLWKATDFHPMKHPAELKMLTEALLNTTG
ncbi:hypothetical protein D6D25_06750, partial [Aureobasidium pullulans]